MRAQRVDLEEMFSQPDRDTRVMALALQPGRRRVAVSGTGDLTVRYGYGNQAPSDDLRHCLALLCSGPSLLASLLRRIS